MVLLGWVARKRMMRASLSRCRLRAFARLVLARRAVARRPDRAGAAAGLRSKTWATTALWGHGVLLGLSRTALMSDAEARFHPLTGCHRVVAFCAEAGPSLA